MDQQTASVPVARHPDTLSAEQALALFTRPRRTPQTDDELAFLGQADHRHTVTHDGRRLAAWRWGSEGPRVLLVHGWESRASHWSTLIGELRQRGLQVVAFDAPAHGQSDGDSTNVVDIGRAALAVAAQLGPVDAVAGHSVGSAATLHALAQGLRVRASVHIAGPVSLRRVLEGFARMGRMDDGERQRFLRLVESRIGAPLDSMDLPALRSGLRHPGLILHDLKDPEVPYDASVALRQAWPQATLLTVDGPGHRRIIRDSGVIGAISEFLVRTVSTGRASA